MAEQPPSQPRDYHRSNLYVRARPGLILRDRKVTRLAARARNVCPWLAASDHPAVRAWCELEILAEQAFIILRTDGLTTQAGEPRRILDDYRKLRSVQTQLSRELGMTPLARRQLRDGNSDATDLPAIFARNDSDAPDADPAAEPENNRCHAEDCSGENSSNNSQAQSPAALPARRC